MATRLTSTTPVKISKRQFPNLAFWLTSLDTSEESKQHSRQVLDDEYDDEYDGGETNSRASNYQSGDTEGKNPNNV